MKTVNPVKNVLIYLSMKPHDGGKYQYSLNILEALTILSQREGFNFTAICNDPQWEQQTGIRCIAAENTPSFIERKLRRLFLAKLPMISLWRFVGRFFDPLQRQFYAQNADIIFYPGNDSYAYECAIPSVIPIFDLMHRYEPQFTEVGEETVVRDRDRHYRRVCSYAKYILADSKLGKDQIMESYECSPEKIVVLPYTPPRYIYDTVDVKILDRFGLPDQFILYPAQFWSHKNHIAIIRALSILREHFSMIVNAVFVGSNKNAHDSVRMMIHDAGLEEQIRILGYVDNAELTALYHRASALVFASFFGPTNIPPLEAAASGCPVIISDIYAHREQLGDDALYFDPKDPQELAEVLHAFFSGSKRSRAVTGNPEQWSRENQLKKSVTVIGEIIRDLD